MNFRGSEWLILILLLVLLFGAKRLPDAARGLGRSLRIFKAETKGLVDETKTGYQEGTGSAPQTPGQPQPPAQIAGQTADLDGLRGAAPALDATLSTAPVTQSAQPQGTGTETGATGPGDQNR